MEFLIISGLSGAGKSRAASVMEDLGYFCVDNLPVPLIPKFAELGMGGNGEYDRVVLVTDIRGGTNFEGLFQALDRLTAMKCSYRILFMDASDAAIIKRYKETRRVHPLGEEYASLEQAIQMERKVLAPLRERADWIVDTTGLTLGQLRSKLLSLFSKGKEEGKMEVHVLSFGFKHGVPMEADLVFDVRFLPNPYYIAELKECTGLEEAVRSFLFGYRQTTEFLRHLEELFAFLLPQYVEEGKSSLVIAIGCTGGHHRSVAVAHAVTEFLRQKGYRVEENHRDISR